MNEVSHALTMLYLQSQDLKGKTPAEIQTMYYETYYELKRDMDANRDKYIEIKHRAE